MARSLSQAILSSMLKSNRSVKVCSGLVAPQVMRCSTRIGSDMDTHEDFRPSNKSSDLSLEDLVRQDVKENPVMIYMKGLPEAPQCGFSALAVKVLQLYGVPINARNILENPELKQGIKAVTNWPTFPQVFIQGEFVGGSDIVLDMHQKGELENLLKDVTPVSRKD